MERRKYPRVTVQYKVTLAFKGGGMEGEATLMNLSEGGCAVRGTKPIPNQAVLLLRISLPDCDSPIEIKSAHVCWVRGWDFGVEFLNVEPELQQRLRRLIQELQTQKNGPECSEGRVT